MVDLTTRCRIPVLISLLKEKRAKKDQCDGEVTMATTSAMTTATAAANHGSLESGTKVRGSGQSRLPTGLQGLSRLLQISRTTPTTSDRNSNNICHSVIAPPCSGSSLKSTLRLAAQSNPTSSSRETVHVRANHRRRNDDDAGAPTERSVPPAERLGTDATPPAKVSAAQSRRKVGGGVSLDDDDAHCCTVNRDEWAGLDLSRAHSVRSNHCRTNNDNNGNTAVPQVDWSGTERTSGGHQETSHRIHLSGSLKVRRTSPRRNSSRLKLRRLNRGEDGDRKKCPESDTSVLPDNAHLRKVLPASCRSATVDSICDAEIRKT